jgi:hypothetical protein
VWRKVDVQVMGIYRGSGGALMCTVVFSKVNLVTVWGWTKNGESPADKPKSLEVWCKGGTVERKTSMCG